MSRRRNSNAIRGPQSALTDFLAANNISANQIRLDYQARRDAAERQATQDGAAADENQDPGEGPSTRPTEPGETPEEMKKRKRKEAAAVAKIKKSKEFAKRKKDLRGEPGEEDDDEIAWDMYKKDKPLPGQLENCENCEKRFTVTPYSREGPDGGLLCTKCGKLQDEEKKKDAKLNKKASTGVREKRRKVQSNLLDGLRPLGAKSLQEHCVELVAANINDIEEFGDLPPALLDRLSQILSKRRVINSRTFDLFLRPDLDTIAVYDCAKLNADDFKKIFAISPNIQHLTLEHAGQFKDEVIDYMLDRKVPLRTLKIESANLITDDKWKELFEQMGTQLENLKLTWLDSSMDDKVAALMLEGCPNLKYLKLKKCFRLGDDTIKKIGDLKNLEHLSLLFKMTTEKDNLDDLIRAVGPNLKTLALQKFENADDETLHIIHDTCHNLSKLRFADNDYCTDGGYAALFFDWDNPPLSYVNLSDCRDMEHNPANDPPEDPVGLADNGFKALMAHSGPRLERLNIKSARYITNGCLMDIFDGEKQYPMLKEVDMSFVNMVDTTSVAGMFKSCPSLEKLVVFGCFNIKDIIVPQGVALIGVPTAQDSIIQEGEFMKAMMEEMKQEMMDES